LRGTHRAPSSKTRHGGASQASWSGVVGTPTDGRNLLKGGVRGYHAGGDFVVSDPIPSAFAEHGWKHIILTLAALALGLIAMITMFAGCAEHSSRQTS
jgi:hypothetical protein